MTVRVGREPARGCGAGALRQRRRSLTTRVPIAILLAMTVSLARPSPVRAGCNIIPPVQAQALPSTLGSVASPITAAGQQVEIQLASECDVLGNGLPAYFEPSAPSNVVTVRFLPAGPGQPPPVQVAPDEVVGCAGAGGAAPCTILRFTMPDTSAPGTPYGWAGPAEIVVTNDGRGGAHRTAVRAARDRLELRQAAGDVSSSSSRCCRRRTPSRPSSPTWLPAPDAGAGDARRRRQPARADRLGGRAAAGPGLPVAPS